MKKKILLVLSSFLLVLSSIIFSACSNNNNNNISLTPSASFVEVALGETREIIFGIDNYNDSMSSKLNVSSDESRVKITKQEYLGNGKTKVTILGIHGGNTVLRATSLEGNKTASVQVKVGEPLKSILKKEKTLYAVGGTINAPGQFVPSSNDFSFYPETTLERNLSYFYTDPESKELYQFDKVLVVDKGSELDVSFVYNDEEVYSLTTYHASRIDYLANFHRESDNVDISCDSYFYILKEIDSKKVEIFESDDTSKKNITSVALVNNKQYDFKANITVKAPSTSSLIDIETVVDNQMIVISPTTENHKVVSTIDECTYFNYEITTNSVNAGESGVKFKIRYKGFEIYEVDVKLKVDVLVAPKSMTVNGYAEVNAPMFTLYNHNIGSYGRINLNFAVYPSDSKVTGIRIDGLSAVADKIKLMHKGMSIIAEEGQSPIITDLSYPLQIQGATGINALGPGAITFTVVTDILEEEKYPTYKFNFNVIEGASEISLSEDIYEYAPLNQFSGVFVDLNAGDTVFSGFKIDGQIPTVFSDKIIIEPIDDASDYLRVTQGEGLSLNLSPRKVGLSKYNIILNNGASVPVTFRVVNTFSQAKIKLTEGSNVKQTAYDSGSLKQISISNDKIDGQFTGNTAEIQIYESNNGQIGSISIDASALRNVCTVSVKDPNENTFVIKCLKSGNAEIVFSIKGYEVGEFKLNETTLNIRLNVVSFINLKELKLTNNGTEAHTVDLYYARDKKDLKNDKYLMTTTLSSVFNPIDAFAFVNPVTGDVLQEEISDKFIYFSVQNNYSVWRVDPITGEDILCEGADRLMCGDYTYKIGSDLIIDMSTLTITVPIGCDKGGNIENIRLFANVKQYDIVHTYEVNVRLNPYNEVNGVGLYTYSEEINLDATNSEFLLSAYATSANARQEPTNKKLSIFFLPATNVPETLVNVEILNIDAVNSGAKDHFFSVTYNPSVLESMNGAKAHGHIIIVPTSLLDETGNYNGDIMVRIEIFIGDGSVNNPLAINTAEQLLKIGEVGNEEALKKHYKISGTLDMNYKQVLPIGAYPSGETIADTGIERYNILPFTGSIIGSKGASIINIDINKTVIEIISGEQSSVTYYSGLFADMQGVIGEISFAGHFSLDENTVEAQTSDSIANPSAYLGIIAAKNSGTILNCSVISDNKGSIAFKRGESVNAGMVCGLNEGKIVNLVWATSINNVTVNLKHELVLGSKTVKTSGNFGGVSGSNNGIISTGVDKSANLYNLSGYTSFVNVLNYSSMNVGGISGSNSSEGQIGFAFSLNINSSAENKIPGLSQITMKGESSDYYSSLDGYLLEDNNFYYNFCVGGIIDSVEGEGNIGGVVGSFSGGFIGIEKPVSSDPNKVEQKSSIVRTFLRGKEQKVGLITTARSNYANIKNIVIETTEDGSSTSINSSQMIIYRTKNDNKDVTKSDVIDFYKESDKVDENLFKDITNLKPDESGISVKDRYFNHISYLLFGKSGNENEADKLYNFEAFDKLNIIFGSYSERINTQFPTGLSSYYGDVIVINKTENNTQSVYRRYVFKKLATSLDITPNESFQMTAGQDVETGINVFYAFYYKAVDATRQNELNKNNIIRPYDSNYPFVLSSNVYIVSESNSISITEDGSLVLSGTGLCRLYVKSSLNATKQQIIYMYLTNYADREGNTRVYSSAITDDGALNESSEIRVYENSPATIYFSLYSNGVKTVGNTIIQTEENTQGILEVKYLNNNGEAVSEKNYTTVTRNGMIYTFTKNNVPVVENEETKNIVELQSIFSVTIGNYTFVGKINNNPTKIAVALRRGTYDMNHDYRDFSITPSNSLEVVTEIKTDDPNDTFYVRYIKRNLEIGGDETDDSVVRIYKNNSGIYEVDNTHAGLFFVSIISQKLEGNILTFKLSYTINNNFVGDIYGDYVLKLLAENGYGSDKDIAVTVEPQGINNVIINNYEDSNSSGPLYPDSNITVPGKPSIMYIELSPENANYNYITIENTDLNYTEGHGAAFFNLVEFKDNKYVRVEGYELTERGIRIPRDLILNDKFIIEYRVPTVGVLDSVSIVFKINAYYNHAIVGEFAIELTTKLASKVELTLSGKTKEAGGEYTVARGLRYKLDLDVYGYYDDQIRIESSKPEIASAEEVNGEWYLQITTNPVAYPDNQGLNLNLISYGIDSYNVKGAESICKIIVMEYIVMFGGKNNDIFENQHEGVIRTAVGNKVNLNIKLINGVNIEYNDTIPSIRDSVNLFEKTLINGGSLKVLTNLSENNMNGKPIVYDNGNLIMEDGKYKLSTVSDVRFNTAIETIYFSINGYSMIPTRIHDGYNPMFRFDFRATCKIENGMYVLSGSNEGASNLTFTTSLAIDVYQRSSKKSPIPITEYSQLMTMEDGGYYILLEDITIPTADFVPITTTIGGLDGNSHKIIFNGSYNFDTNNIGLFGLISQGTLIQNLTVEVLMSSTFYIVKEIPDYSIGLIAGENNGIITNCQVVCKEYATLSVVSYAEGNSTGSYFAGMVGKNSGNGSITNSRVQANLYGACNMSGLVGFNSGIISSSFVRSSNIQNVSQSKDNRTAGVVVENAVGAKILSTYINGESLNINQIYADNKQKSIKSAQNVGGFVYNNKGDIFDCYANIPIIGSSAVAGFVYANAGTIKNTYTTCLLENLNTLNMPFIAVNSIDELNGKIESSFYLQDYGINVDIGSNEGISGLTKLNIKGFNPTNPLFESFAVSTSEITKGIWFAPTGTTEPDFLNPNTEVLNFQPGRLELVSPNLLSYSSLSLDENRSGIDETTGEMKYYYNVSSNGLPMGSKFNPVLITNANDFEEEILLSSNLNINSNYYRIVSNLDYSTANSSISQLSETIITGDIEGNGMKISGFILDSNKILVNAGLFAQIGNGSSQMGSIKNLTLEPKLVSFPNTNIVGALAGTVNSGYVINVNVDGFKYSEEGVVVTGKNIVGGVIGRAINNFKLFNISTKSSAKANYMPSLAGIIDHFTYDKEITYNLSLNNYNKVSYAGGLVGIMEGEGQAKFLYASGDMAVIGEKIGVIFGRVGSGAKADKVEVTMSENMLLRAHYYGGLVMGELAGYASNVHVYGTPQQISVFRSSPRIPEAIGVMIGAIKEGTLEVAKNTQSLIVETGIFGGIAGKMFGGTISQVVQSANITLATVETNSNVLGGIVGSATGKIEINEVASRAETLLIDSDNVNSIHLGGIIGKQLQNVGNLKIDLHITNSYCSSDLQIKAYAYNQEIKASTSGIINGVDKENLKIENFFAVGQSKVFLADRLNSDISLETVRLGLYGDGASGNDKTYNAANGLESDSITVMQVNFKFLGELDPLDTANKFKNVIAFAEDIAPTNISSPSTVILNGRSVFQSATRNSHKFTNYAYYNSKSNDKSQFTNNESTLFNSWRAENNKVLYEETPTSSYNGEVFRRTNGSYPRLSFEDSFKF